MKTSTEIQTELTEVCAAMKAVLLGQKYSFDSGQGKQTVERADYEGLQKYKQSLESDLSIAELREGNCQITRGISC